MTVLKVGLLIAAVAFFCFAFFKLVCWTCAEWKKIEAEEEELRQAGPRAVTRGGELNQATGSDNRSAL